MTKSMMCLFPGNMFIDTYFNSSHTITSHSVQQVIVYRCVEYKSKYSEFKELFFYYYCVDFQEILSYTMYLCVTPVAFTFPVQPV